MEHVDVLIVGAGLSGIAAAHHLMAECPNKTFAILEAREAMGGTWDLFRYPGIRSDSDMYTLGYSFAPWQSARAIADGPSILAYIRETAKADGTDRKIRYDSRATRASWSSETSAWTVDVAHPKAGGATRISCRFLMICTGYYDYASGHAPSFPGAERYQGVLVHPQHWPEDLDWSGKRIVVIGSGATAVTLVPELAKKAAHVTMLQRSPSYVVSLPAVDAIAEWTRKKLGAKAAHRIVRLKNITLAMAFYNFSRRFPKQAKGLFVGGVKRALGRAVDVKKHFTPRYDPWDQRLCFVPDGDLFDALESGRADVVTDTIETFTERGVRLASGETIEADIIVTATGLNVLLFGDMKLEVDGALVDPSKKLNYRGSMLSDVPNMAMTIGYTNASWTLKCDLVCEYVCRLLRAMDDGGYRRVTPRVPAEGVGELPLIDFSSGYVTRALDRLPKQGNKAPWRLHQNYFLDVLGLRYGAVVDSALELR